MALSSLVEFVILVVKNPCYQQDDASSSIQEISISASEIASWDMSEILSYGSVKVRAHRTRLIQESSYFHGLLSGSFSESGLDHISVEWNLESFLNLLMCLYGYDIEITSSSFLPLFEVSFLYQSSDIFCLFLLLLANYRILNGEYSLHSTLGWRSFSLYAKTGFQCWHHRMTTHYRK
jgi:hypothetical protein